MDTVLHKCFICNDSETAAQKLLQATSKGYPTLLEYAEAVGDVAVLERMKEAWSARELRYHLKCRRDLYNNSIKANIKSTRK